MCAICNFKVEFDIGHPLALTVAVATRAAIEAGMLPEQVFEGPLGNMKLRVAAIDTLKDFQDRLEAVATPSELRALPDFYVLLIESGTWGYFHATDEGFDPDIEPNAPNVTAEVQADRDIVLVTAQSSLQCILTNNVTLGRAFSDNLLILDASPEDAHLLSFTMKKAFAEKQGQHSLAS